VSDFPEITTEQIVARLRMIVAEPESLCKTDFHYIEDAADEIELLRSTVTDCRIEIERLTAERDEARFAAAYQYAKHHNGNVQTLMDNFCELKGWQKFQFFVGDDDHAKEGL
jgi:hypothetical protein